MPTRRTFAEIVQGAGVDARLEYITLWNLFNRRFDSEKGLNVGYVRTVNMMCRDVADESFATLVNKNFLRLPIQLRKSYRTLEMFNRGCGFSFGKEPPSTMTVDDLLTYIEYTMSFINMMNEAKLLQDFGFAVRPFVSHVNVLLDMLAHATCVKDGFVFVVPKSQPVIEVARVLPGDLSYKTYMYNHRTVTGDLNRKKEILRALGDALESRRKELALLDGALTSAIFAMLNRANVRHTNIDERDPAKYQPIVAAMGKEELEQRYDDLYQMILLAFMWLDSRSVVADTKEFVSTLKP